MICIFAYDSDIIWLLVHCLGKWAMFVKWVLKLAPKKDGESWMVWYEAMKEEAPGTCWAIFGWGTSFWDIAISQISEDVPPAKPHPCQEIIDYYVFIYYIYIYILYIYIYMKESVGGWVFLVSEFVGSWICPRTRANPTFPLPEVLFKIQWSTISSI